jgi:hypothetical protein
MSTGLTHQGIQISMPNMFDQTMMTSTQSKYAAAAFSESHGHQNIPPLFRNECDILEF